MKRSEIDAHIDEACVLFEKAGFYLPPFAFWTPLQWQEKGSEANEIRHTGMGWDVTDYGKGDFTKMGLLLFTIRNGGGPESPYRKGYAEKIMVVGENQVTPFHFHFRKMEDIINRGGGNLVLELYQSDEKGNFSDDPCTVSIDGVERRVDAGGRVILGPGESICLTQNLYHTFYGEPGSGPVIVGEVSAVNDDRTDNRFHQSVGRYPDIEEDQSPRHLLCTEYPEAG